MRRISSPTSSGSVSAGRGLPLGALVSASFKSRVGSLVQYAAPMPNWNTREAVERSRQKMASDPAMQNFLQGWRAMFPGAADAEVY